jgi:DNA invertase Pin-like site-specific DNA recombinase
MKFGYARVSKTEQCLEVQIQKLKAAGCDEIFMEKARTPNDEADRAHK